MTEQAVLGSAENTQKNLAELAARRYEGYTERQANLLFFMLSGYSGAPTREDCRQIMLMLAVKAAQKHDPARSTFSTYLLNYLRWQVKTFRKEFFRRRAPEQKIIETSQITRAELRDYAPPDPSVPAEQGKVAELRELFASLSPENKHTLGKIIDAAGGSLDEAAKLVSFRRRGGVFAECNISPEDWQALRLEIASKRGQFW